MGNNAVSPYQQVIEKTKSLSFRSQMLAMNIEKKVAHSNRNEVDSFSRINCWGKEDIDTINTFLPFFFVIKPTQLRKTELSLNLQIDMLVVTSVQGLIYLKLLLIIQASL